MEALLPEDIIFEMVLTTVDAQGRPNAAPVGVTRKGSELRVELASGTRSLENLLHNGTAALSIVYDPLVFARTAFNQTSADMFDNSHRWRVPAISGAAASIMVSLVSRHPVVRDDELGHSAFQRVAFRPLRAEIPGFPRPHSRRFAATLEVIISLTKATVAAERGLGHLIPRIQETVEEHLAIARRTGTDSPTEEALQLCLRELASIREKERSDHARKA
jgi:hypothetical protein